MIITGELTCLSPAFFSAESLSVTTIEIWPMVNSAPQGTIWPESIGSPLKVTAGKASCLTETQQPSGRGATSRCSSISSSQLTRGIPAVGDLPNVAWSPSMG